MAIYLMRGNVVRPTEYAKKTGQTRQNVYHQLKVVQRAGLKVERIRYGEWALNESNEDRGEDQAT